MSNSRDSRDTYLTHLENFEDNETILEKARQNLKANRPETKKEKEEHDKLSNELRRLEDSLNSFKRVDWDRPAAAQLAVRNWGRVHAPIAILSASIKNYGAQINRRLGEKYRSEVRAEKENVTTAASSEVGAKRIIPDLGEPPTDPLPSIPTQGRRNRTRTQTAPYFQNEETQMSRNRPSSTTPGIPDNSAGTGQYPPSSSGTDQNPSASSLRDIDGRFEVLREDPLVETNTGTSLNARKKRLTVGNGDSDAEESLSGNESDSDSENNKALKGKERRDKKPASSSTSSSTSATLSQEQQKILFQILRTQNVLIPYLEKRLKEAPYSHAETPKEITKFKKDWEKRKTKLEDRLNLLKQTHTQSPEEKASIAELIENAKDQIRQLDNILTQFPDQQVGQPSMIVHSSDKAELIQGSDEQDLDAKIQKKLQDLVGEARFHASQSHVTIETDKGQSNLKLTPVLDPLKSKVQASIRYSVIGTGNNVSHIFAVHRQINGSHVGQVHFFNKRSGGLERGLLAKAGHFLSGNQLPTDKMNLEAHKFVTDFLRTRPPEDREDKNLTIKGNLTKEQVLAFILAAHTNGLKPKNLTNHREIGTNVSKELMAAFEESKLQAVIKAGGSLEEQRAARGSFTIDKFYDRLDGDEKSFKNPSP